MFIHARLVLGLSAALGAVCIWGCRAISGLSDLTFEEASGTGGEACMPGELRECYSGSLETINQGLCRAGAQTCDDASRTFGPCMGEVTPAQETCATPTDEDCDGQIDEEGPDCACAPGSVSSCYSGPGGSDGFAPCKAGSHACNDNGIGYGPCMGAIGPAPEDCATAADEDCGTGIQCPGDSLWSNWIPGEGDSEIDDIAVDPVGNILVGGEFSGTLDLPDMSVTPGSAGDDFYIASFSAQGTYLGARVFGTSASDAEGVRDICPDGKGNAIITGRFSAPLDFGMGPLIPNGEDAYVLKMNGEREILWVTHIQGAGAQRPDEVAVGPDGSVTVLGTFSAEININGQVNFAAAGGDLFLAQLDGDTGVLKWLKPFGDGSDQTRAGEVAVSSASEIFIATPYSGSVNLGCGQLSGTQSLVVAAFDQVGACKWSSSYGTNLGASIRVKIASFASNRVFVGTDFTGSLQMGGPEHATAPGNTDVLVAALSNGGAYLWSKSFSSAGNEVLAGIAVDSTGNPIVAGQFSGAVDFGGGVVSNTGTGGFIVKLDAASGAHLWSRNPQSSGQMLLSSLATEPGGGIWIAGRFSGSIQFGGQGENYVSIAGSGMYDAFVSRLKP